MNMHITHSKETILNNLGKVLKDVISNDTGDGFDPLSLDHRVVPAGSRVVNWLRIQTNTYHMATARVN